MHDLAIYGSGWCLQLSRECAHRSTVHTAAFNLQSSSGEGGPVWSKPWIDRFVGQTVSLPDPGACRWGSRELARQHICHMTAITCQIACLAARNTGSPDLPLILEQCCQLLACLMTSAPAQVQDTHAHSLVALVSLLWVPFSGVKKCEGPSDRPQLKIQCVRLALDDNVSTAQPLRHISYSNMPATEKIRLTCRTLPSHGAVGSNAMNSDPMTFGDRMSAPPLRRSMHAVQRAVALFKGTRAEALASYQFGGNFLPYLKQASMAAGKEPAYRIEPVPHR
jgi:hypothetical protein